MKHLDEQTMKQGGRPFRRTRGSRAQATVEFALVCVLLILVVFGTIDFGRLFFTWASMSNAAREGARFGSVHPQWWTEEDSASPRNIEHVTRSMLFTLGTTEPEVEIHCFHAHGQAYGDGRNWCSKGNQIDVIVRASFHSWTPIIPAINLAARATMVIE